MNCNKNNIEKLRGCVESQLVPLIDDDFILLDIPNHRNVGDSLIWKGELAFFSKLKSRCLKQYNRYTFKKNAIKDNNTIILLHGGGNFGDIYQSSQTFKRFIIQSFPKNRIIVLPQTVHYNKNENLENDFKIFNNHPDLHIFVRDYPSLEIVKNNLVNGRFYLAPDMAFFLDFDMLIYENYARKSLYLNRTDAEANNELIFIDEKQDYDIADWPTYKSNSNNINKIFNYIEALDGKLSNVIKNIPCIAGILDDSYGLKKKGSMDLHINKGVSFLNQYDKIFTTRLHGLILGILLNKEVIIIDNKYGKSRAFYETWLREFSNVKLIK